MKRILLLVLQLSLFLILSSCSESSSVVFSSEQNGSEVTVESESAVSRDNSITEREEIKRNFSIDDYSDREPSQVVGVVYNGEFYGFVGVIFSSDELNEYISQGVYIVESVPIDMTDFENEVDGEIAAMDPVPKNEFESQSPGCALYLIDEYIITAYNEPFYNKTLVVPIEETYSYGLISKRLLSSMTENG